MTEIRCVKCNKRLFDLENKGEVRGVVIKCEKCGYFNKVTKLKVNEELFPKGEIESVIQID